ncbi:MAG TPA: hypothetical protein VJH03_22400 [Blastocatellia bacterium]|nr:hypothetical protein [Blastocatellia bacterium]
MNGLTTSGEANRCILILLKRLSCPSAATRRIGIDGLSAARLNAATAFGLGRKPGGSPLNRSAPKTLDSKTATIHEVAMDGFLLLILTSVAPVFGFGSERLADPTRGVIQLR